MKFNLRELFLLVMVVALAVGWWADRTRLKRDNSALMSRIRSTSNFAANLALVLINYDCKIDWDAEVIRVTGPSGNEELRAGKFDGQDDIRTLIQAIEE